MKGSKNPAARKVQCITTGKTFNTIKEAGEYYLLTSCSDISKVCRGKQTFRYWWKYQAD